MTISLCKEAILQDFILVVLLVTLHMQTTKSYVISLGVNNCVCLCVYQTFKLELNRAPDPAQMNLPNETRSHKSVKRFGKGSTKSLQKSIVINSGCGLGRLQNCRVMLSLKYIFEGFLASEIPIISKMYNLLGQVCLIPVY